MSWLNRGLFLSEDDHIEVRLYLLYLVIHYCNIPLNKYGSNCFSSSDEMYRVQTRQRFGMGLEYDRTQLQDVTAWCSSRISMPLAILTYSMKIGIVSILMFHLSRHLSAMLCVLLCNNTAREVIFLFKTAFSFSWSTFESWCVYVFTIKHFEFCPTSSTFQSTSCTRAQQKWPLSTAV